MFHGFTCKLLNGYLVGFFRFHGITSATIEAVVFDKDLRVAAGADGPCRPVVSATVDGDDCWCFTIHCEIHFLEPVCFMEFGFDIDSVRWMRWSPAQDSSDVAYAAMTTFGSAHPGVFSVLMCDGSVKRLSLSLDAKLWKSFGTVSGGEINE